MGRRAAETAFRNAPMPAVSEPPYHEATSSRERALAMPISSRHRGGRGAVRIRRGSRSRPSARLAALLLCVGLLQAPALARAAGRFVVAREQRFTPRLTAYARVEPTAVLSVRARLAGTVDGLACLPGDKVQTGSVIARLTGPAITAQVAERRASVQSTAAALRAAREALVIDRRKLESHLSTRLAVEQAQAAVTEAEAGAAVAGARLQATLAMQTVKSPVDGRVLALHTSIGQHVEPGQSLVSIEPARSLWLRAVFYGADASAIHAGMVGSFSALGGGPPEPVRVRSVFASLDPDGGEGVGLLPRGTPPAWRDGQAGTVTLLTPERRVVAIPTRALILDRGRWWVLVHTVHGDRKQAVTPGPSRGDATLVLSGLPPGTPVVVENPYLEFHRRLSQQYRPTD